MANLVKSTELDNVAVEMYLDKNYIARRALADIVIIQSYNTQSKKMYFQYVLNGDTLLDSDTFEESEATELYNYLVKEIGSYECRKCGAVAFRIDSYPLESKVKVLYEGGKEIGISPTKAN